MKTAVFRIDPVMPDKLAVSEVAAVVKRGGIVVFPTETVYGIGADAFNEAACKRIFEVKGRPSDNPMIVHVSSMEMARSVGVMPEEYVDRIRRVWPSPITFVVKAAEGVPKSVTGGLDTVAVRMPAHPVALELISQSGPIAAPSANPSKKPSATSPGQAMRYFDGEVDCVIDSGRAFFGVESTIIDLKDFSISRPGPFTLEEIRNAFGAEPKVDDVARGKKYSEVATSPGMKYAHYAPDTKLLLFDGKPGSLEGVLDNAENLPAFVFLGSKESCEAASGSFGCSTIALGSRSNMYEIAKNLYDGLIALDSMKVAFGIIEAFEETGIGLAIMNRIRKACSGRAFGDADGLRKLLEP